MIGNQSQISVSSTVLFVVCLFVLFCFVLFFLRGGFGFKGLPLSLLFKCDPPPLYSTKCVRQEEGNTYRVKDVFCTAEKACCSWDLRAHGK